MNSTIERSLYGLIGDPVGHSLSPFIMNRAFGEKAIDAMYLAFSVSENHARDAIHGLRALGFIGANVTYPLKESVLPLADEKSTAVELIEAVNTVRFTDRGIVTDNTDSIGVVQALEVLGDRQVRGKGVLICGGGGAARAAAYGLLMAGARGVTFATRDEGTAMPVVERYGSEFADRQIDWRDVTTLTSERHVFEEVDIIINATPIGMSGFGKAALIMEDSMIESTHCCVDFVYHPRETSFITAAKRRGAQTIDGLAILVAQARAAFHLWTGKDFSLAEMYDAASHEQGRVADEGETK